MVKISGVLVIQLIMEFCADIDQSSYGLKVG